MIRVQQQPQGYTIPASVQRATGVDYFHIPVYASRLILQEVVYDGGDGGGGNGGSGEEGSLVLLKAHAVVKTKLCDIPVCTRVSCCTSSIDTVSEIVSTRFKSMCQRVRKSVASLPQTYSAHAPWCIAVLHAGSTVEKGPFSLIVPGGGPLVVVRGGDGDGGDGDAAAAAATSPHASSSSSSLQDHMIASGLLDTNTTAANHLALLPAEGRGEQADDTDFDTRSYVRSPLHHLVDNLAVTYRWDRDTGQAVLQQQCVSRFSSQLCSFHRLSAYDSQGLVRMRNTLRELWDGSFVSHGCYVVGAGDGGGAGGDDDYDGGAGGGCGGGIGVSAVV